MFDQNLKEAEPLIIAPEGMFFMQPRGIDAQMHLVKTNEVIEFDSVLAVCGDTIKGVTLGSNRAYESEVCSECLSACRIFIGGKK